MKSTGISVKMLISGIFYKRFLTHLKYSLNLTKIPLFLKNIGYTCKQSYDELEMSQRDSE